MFHNKFPVSGTEIGFFSKTDECESINIESPINIELGRLLSPLYHKRNTVPGEPLSKFTISEKSYMWSYVM